VLLAGAPGARADFLDALSPAVETSGVVSVDDLGRDAFGWGGGVAAHLELNIVSSLGVHVGAAFMLLSPDSQPETVWWVGSRIGMRFHWTAFLDHAGDGWLDVHHEIGRSGDIVRQGFDVGVGYSFVWESEITVGPTLRMMYARDPRGDPTILLLFGVELGFLPYTRLHGEPPDDDLDGTPDHLDRCPQAPTGAYEDPDRSGCPAADSDGDGVVDPLDACDSETMWPHPDRDDADRYGCPLADGDEDGVPDRIDMCPDTFAEDGGDALREGCPPGAIDW
jgi:hypothetical protein